MIGNNLHPDFLFDDEFRDLFENLIVFTYRTFLKNEEVYEDDVYDENEFRDEFPISDNEFDNDSDSESEFEFYNDISSNSDTDSD